MSLDERWKGTCKLLFYTAFSKLEKVFLAGLTLAYLTLT